MHNATLLSVHRVRRWVILMLHMHHLLWYIDQRVLFSLIYYIIKEVLGNARKLVPWEGIFKTKSRPNLYQVDLRAVFFSLNPSWQNFFHCGNSITQLTSTKHIHCSASTSFQYFSFHVKWPTYQLRDEKNLSSCVGDLYWCVVVFTVFE